MILRLGTFGHQYAMSCFSFLSQCCVTASLVLAGGVANAASPEWETPPVSHKDVKPYFDARSLYTLVLPPPPLPDSATDRDDVAAVMLRQQVDAARRQAAELDGKLLYDRFADVFGQPVRRDVAPALVQLLNRAVRQVSGPAFAAKDVFRRLRPYQRLQLSHVCGKTEVKPDPDSLKRTSYPSGHTAYGWTTALVLARVAPDKAQALLQRAVEYADSRVICGMHFPSDVEAGRQLATAVVAHLDNLPEFQRDLEAARAELAAALAAKP
jgi:acid phosphatase (class A)